MTSVKITRSGNAIICIAWSGHAEYENNAPDIVCAAISTLMTTCVNALESVAGIKPTVAQCEKAARVTVTLPKALTGIQSHDAQIVLQTVLQGLADLEREYPKHIRILDGRKLP